MRPNDKYRNYAKLCENEREGIDLRICVTDRAASVALIAPHGGKIEPGTSEIATAIAGGRDCEFASLMATGHHFRRLSHHPS